MSHSASTPIRARFPLLAAALVLLAAFFSGDLLAAWLHSPENSFGWFAALVWLLPVIFLGSPAERLDNACLLAAFFSTLLGLALSLNPLLYFGLALGLASFVPFSSAKLPWLASAAAWMPFFENLGGPILPHALVWARVGTVLIGIVLFAWAALLAHPEPPARQS